MLADQGLTRLKGKQQQQQVNCWEGTQAHTHSFLLLS